MAKQITTGTLHSVKFGEIAHNHDVINRVVRKTRRPKEAKDLLKHLLAINGWDAAKGVCIIFDAKSPIWDTFKDEKGNSGYQKILDESYDERCKYLEALETSPEPDNKVRLEVFKALYLDGNGKVIKPKYLATAGTGRSELYFDAMFMRLKGYTYRDEEYVPQQDVVDTVPVQYRVFKTEAERVQAQAYENDKKQGQYEVSSTDKLNTIWYLYRTVGMTQKQARDMFPGTTGQKGWLICRLHSLWSESNENERFPNEAIRPNLDLVDRCFLKPKEDEGRYISFASFSAESIPGFTELIDRSSPNGLQKRNEKISKDNATARSKGHEDQIKRPLMPATAEEVESFVMQKGGNGPKALPKKVWDAYNGGSAGRVAAKFAKAALSGETEGLKIITENTEVFNRVLGLIEKDQKKDVIAALSDSVLNHPMFPMFVEWAMCNKPFQLVAIETIQSNGQEHKKPEEVTA